MVFDHQTEHASQWTTITSIASKIGCNPETLRSWVRQAERDRELLAIELQALVDLDFGVEITGSSLAEIDLVLDEARESSPQPEQDAGNEVAIRHFLVSAEHPRFSAVWCGCIGRFSVSVRQENRSEAVWGLSSLACENHFPVRGEGAVIGSSLLSLAELKRRRALSLLQAEFSNPEFLFAALSR